MIIITFSRIRSWRRCRRQHFYKFIKRIQRKKPPMPFFKGDAVHELCKAYLTGKAWTKKWKEYAEAFNKLFAEEREMHGDVPGDLKRVMEGYVKRWKDDGLKYISVEKRYDFDLGPQVAGAVFSFEPDALVQDEKKRKWLFERKTAKTLPDEDFRLSDIQTILYRWALSRVGIPIDGVLWDYVRTKPPTIPQQLKNGGLSVAQNIDTDYDTYLGEVKRLKLDPREYKEKLDSLVGAETRFYKRVYMPVSDDVMAKIVKDMIRTAKEIVKRPKSKVRTLTRDCNQCEFYQLCQAELRDLDTDFILKTQYEKSKYEGLSNEKAEVEE